MQPPMYIQRPGFNFIIFVVNFSIGIYGLLAEFVVFFVSFVPILSNHGNPTGVIMTIVCKFDV